MQWGRVWASELESGLLPLHLSCCAGQDLLFNLSELVSSVYYEREKDTLTFLVEPSYANTPLSSPRHPLPPSPSLIFPYFYSLSSLPHSPYHLRDWTFTGTGAACLPLPSSSLVPIE